MLGEENKTAKRRHATLTLFVCHAAVVAAAAAGVVARPAARTDERVEPDVARVVVDASSRHDRRDCPPMTAPSAAAAAVRRRPSTSVVRPRRRPCRQQRLADEQANHPSFPSRPLPRRVKTST